MSLFDSYNLRGPGLWQGFLETFAARELECVQVEVTSVCPGRCVYCPHTTATDSWKSRHMVPDVFAALWPLLRRTARVHLQGWGEPLLHPHFFDFVELALRAGCRVSTTTCGLRMDEALAERLVASGVDIVAFSLTGTDDASNAAREGVPFSRVREAVLTLQRVRKSRMGVHMEIHLAYLLLASGIPALQRLPALMDEWDVHGTVVSTMDFIAHPSLAPEAFLPHEHEKIEAARVALEAVRSATSRDFWYDLPCPDPAPQCRERIHATLYVDAEGQVSPCIYLNVPAESPRRFVCGNVLHESPLHIWQQPDYACFRQRMANGDPDPLCLHCPKLFSRGRQGRQG